MAQRTGRISIHVFARRLPIRRFDTAFFGFWALGRGRSPFGRFWFFEIVERRNRFHVSAARTFYFAADNRLVGFEFFTALAAQKTNHGNGTGSLRSF